MDFIKAYLKYKQALYSERMTQNVCGFVISYSKDERIGVTVVLMGSL